MKERMTMREYPLVTPWIESPFFSEILKTMPEKHMDMLTNFYTKGYVIIDAFAPETTEEINAEVDKLLSEKRGKIQAEHFTYTDSPRLFEAWKESEVLKKTCFNSNVIDTLRTLYQKEPFPFSTINFLKPSNQPLHSDAVHFHTIPHRWMAGVWVALEDVSAVNGSLSVVPGSHAWDVYDYQSLGLPHPDTIKDGEKVNYRKYEEFIEKLIEVNFATKISVTLKKGQALIWAANLLHGGTPVSDTSLTRKTMAIHYFFAGCRHYYHPMFSNPLEGQYAKKWCTDKWNIKNWTEYKPVDLIIKDINISNVSASEDDGA